MSIIVNGMDMPNNCFCCPLFIGGHYYGDLSCCQGNHKVFPDDKIYRQTRRKDCPLVEIPTEHGRLVDADKMSADYVHYGIAHCYDVHDLQDILDGVPVVVPAEKGGAE